METAKKHTFLVCYDYRFGGVWFLFDAFNAEQISALHPLFVPFYDKPDWMSSSQKQQYIADAQREGMHFDIETPFDGWLKQCLANL